MRTLSKPIVLLLALALSPIATGCKPKMVEVQSGTQVICTYGEIVSEDYETLLVPEGEAGEHSVETSVVTCPVHLKLEALYARAQEDLAKGDLAAARAKLAEVVAGDPKYRNARDQLDAIDSGDQPPPPGGGGGGGTPPSKTPTAQPSGPAVNLLRYVPDTLAGYSAQAVIADVLSLSRVYLPASGGDVAQLVIAAEQHKDAAQASSKLGALKTSYAADASPSKVAGKDAYFGTNSRGFAIVAVTDGSVLVVFEMYSKSGDAASLKAPLTALADVVL